MEHEDSEGCRHSFDIEIEDADGHGYDVAAWHGTGPLAYEEQRTMARSLSAGGRLLCIDPGKWDPSMKYISKYGGVGDDSEDNFRILIKKMGQMREGRTGVAVACIRRKLKPWLTLIPKE